MHSTKYEKNIFNEHIQQKMFNKKNELIQQKIEHFLSALKFFALFSGVYNFSASEWTRFIWKKNTEPSANNLPVSHYSFLCKISNDEAVHSKNQLPPFLCQRQNAALGLLCKSSFAPWAFWNWDPCSSLFLLFYYTIHSIPIQSTMESNPRKTCC